MRTSPAVPPPALFALSGLSMYLGSAFAVRLFAQVPAASVAWWRVAVAAVVLLAWRRPWRRRWSARELGLMGAFGTTLALMNTFFYLAIDRLPMGTAVAVEFTGPVVVAAVAGGRRERLGILLAAPGVALLAGVTLQVGGSQAVPGLLAIGAAATCWAGYILLGRRVAHAGDGVTRLGVGMAAGALVLAPVLAPPGAPVLGSAPLLGAVLGIAVLSSVVPYGIEQVVLRSVSAATFAVLLATLPAMAVVIGAVVLGQWPHPAEVVGLVAVSAAIALTSRRPVPEEGTPA
ncbi:EamA family transporter [Isoptericola sp. b441]|uniref:EamA family transporter n=1 Tax=Actinotalea lenta TaxID=3064654 RepID=A0ABT9D9J0_9CELL|nr:MULTISPECIES: EamA family transporter [unclassified Isoptericola]MDO8105971.1 EamA family transporter [Isoptericola sp. b441]MDO8122310.1 EamA family transporter [Isoptericola sp. b490]